MEKINFPDVLYENHLKEIEGIKFTRREIEIIAFMLSGRSRKKIAAFLSISPKTVENHTRNIMHKFACNSKEHIVDLIEKSGKLLSFKQYYLHWLIHSEFKEILERLALLKEELICTIVYWPLENDCYFLLPHLKAHLKLAGVKVNNEPRQNQQPLSALLSESTKGTYKLYLLPKYISEEISRHSNNNYIGYHNNSNSKLFILPAQVNSEKFSTELMGYDCIDLTQTKNYYFLMYEICKKLFLNHPIEEIFRDSQHKMAVLLNASSVEEKPLHTHNKNRPPKTNPRRSITQHWLINKSYYAFLILLCLGFSSMLVDYFRGRFTKLDPHTHLKDVKKQWIVRADLAIPTDPIFLDRIELITQMTNKLKKCPETIQTIALQGIGGSGKTTLARQYARLQKSPITWEMNAETRESLMLSFESFAQALAKTEGEKRELKGIRETQNSTEKEEKIIQWVRHRLSLSPNWLILYDNVINFKNIQHYFPNDHNAWGIGKVIITTRNRKMPNNVNDVLTIKELSDNEKLNLFTKILMAFSDHTPLTPAQMEEAKKFLTRIPSFPLDVKLAAHYLQRTNVPFSKYLSYLKEYDTDFETLQKEILIEQGDYHRTRYSIIALSLKEILESHKDFIGLLLLVSLLNSQDIPRDLLCTYKKDILVDKFIHHLQSYSIISEISPFQKKGFLSIHPCIQEYSLIYLQTAYDKDKRKRLLKPLADALGLYASESIRQQDFFKVNNLASHCRSFLDHSNFLTDETRSMISGELGIIYLHLSDFNAAHRILEEALCYLKKQRHDKGNYACMARLSLYLADVYREIGNYDRARILLQDSVQIFRKHFPKDYRLVAMSLTHLGAVYRHIGDLTKSKDLLEEGIDIYEKHSIDDQTDIAWALVHLGNTYREIGDLSKATHLLEKSLRIYVRGFSKNHPTTAWNLSQLGNMYRESGKYEKAKTLLEESLGIYEKDFPHSHDRIAWVLTHLGDIYTYVGDYPKTLITLEKALSIHEKYFSQNHVGVARTLMCLGNAYRESGNYQKAKDILEKSFKVHLRHFSEKHLRLAPVYMNLGLAFRELGHYGEAKSFLNKSLVIYKKNKGNHPVEARRVLRNLGQVHLLEGDLNVAEKLMQQALNVVQKKEHPDLASTFESLADLYLQKSKHAKESQQKSYKKQAIDYLTQTLKITETYLPKNNFHATRIQKKLIKASRD